MVQGAAMFIQTNPTLASYGMAVTSQTTRWPFFVFLAGAMFCLLSSSACHLLSCHSHRLNLFLIRLDYTGIAVMIVVSFFPPIYYIFQCEPHWQAAYLLAITAAGVGTVYALMSPRLSAARYRAHRALLFVGMGLSGVVPAAHATAVNWHEPARNVTLAYEGAMAAAYLTGTAFYLTRVPEGGGPGRSTSPATATRSSTRSSSPARSRTTAPPSCSSRPATRWAARRSAAARRRRKRSFCSTALLTAAASVQY